MIWFVRHRPARRYVGLTGAVEGRWRSVGDWGKGGLLLKDRRSSSHAQHPRFLRDRPRVRRPRGGRGSTTQAPSFARSASISPTRVRFARCGALTVYWNACSGISRTLDPSSTAVDANAPSPSLASRPSASPPSDRTTTNPPFSKIRVEQAAGTAAEPTHRLHPQQQGERPWPTASVQP